MKPTVLLLVTTVVLAACAPLAKDAPEARPGFSDEGVGAQARIGQMLQDAAVTPDFRPCWAQLQGEGAVAADLTYRKSGASWCSTTQR